MLYADIDDQGLARGFYDDQVHAEIPAGAVPITEEVWRGWIADTAGQRWDGEGLVAYTPPAVEAPIPSVTARQLRLWLVSQGRTLGQVDAAIAALPEEQRAPAQIEWEYATAYVRTHPLIGALGGGLGFAPEEIDAGFRAAALL